MISWNDNTKLTVTLMNCLQAIKFNWKCKQTLNVEIVIY